MSTTTLTARRGQELTDPRYYPITSELYRVVNRMADRTDLAMRVLSDTGGAPARFMFTTAYIDLNAKLISGIDPLVIAGPDFARRHPALFGALVHEACHAAKSRWDTYRIHRQYGGRHLTVFMMLEEARCERDNQPNLQPLDRAGLRSCILDIVLRDADPEATVYQSAKRIVGLLAGRIDSGLLDLAEPTVQNLMDKAREVLGDDLFTTYWNLAVRFSKVRWEPYVDNESGLHTIVTEWIEQEDEDPKDDDGGSDEDESDQPGGGGGGQQDEDTDEQPQSGGGGQGQDESDQEPQDGSGGGQPGEDTDDDEQDADGSPDGSGDPSDEDAQDGGEGSDEYTDEVIEVAEGEGQDHYGNYDHADYVTVENDNPIMEALREAASEVSETVTRAEVGPAIASAHRASADLHGERRRKNREARALWQ